jgi:hypothetical protein
MKCKVDFGNEKKAFDQIADLLAEIYIVKKIDEEIEDETTVEKMLIDPLRNMKPLAWLQDKAIIDVISLEKLRKKFERC